MRFASDNRAGVTPEVLAAVEAEAAHPGGGYGEDRTSHRLTEAFTEVFEREVTVFPVLTGTAANSLALAGLCDPWGAVVCHREAHVLVDEGGAPEFFGGGLRLVPLPDDGPDADRIDAAALDGFLRTAAGGRNDVHQVPLQALTLTNLSELGRSYTAAETAEVAGLAHRAGLGVHLDGARFANAVAGTGESPADLTWRAGVDVMSFGATKNGAIGAEAVIYFDPDRATGFERRRKRGGHLLSKMRFVSAQILGQLSDGNWLVRARRANEAATRLATGLAAAGLASTGPIDGNELFVRTSATEAARWQAAGVECYVDESSGSAPTVRLVTSWSTTDEEVDQLIALAGGDPAREEKA
jgi:threonine aldolase